MRIFAHPTLNTLAPSGAYMYGGTDVNDNTLYQNWAGGRRGRVFNPIDNG